MRGHGEYDLQRACVLWFRTFYPNVRIHHSPNGGARSIVTAHNMKMLGTMAGFPDLFIIAPNKSFHGLFIEMKDGKKGRLSEKQVEFLTYLRSQGYAAEVVRDFEEFRTIVNDYFDNSNATN